MRADPPLLEAQLLNQTRTLLVYGVAGTNYTLQSSTNPALASAWSPVLSYTLTNSFQYFTNLGSSKPVLFYRIKKP